MSAATATQQVYFGLEVTRRCNLACPHCCTGSGADQPEGPTREALRRLLSTLAALGARRVALSGGEPMLRADLEEVMSDGLALGLEGFGVVTNGLLVDAARAGRLARAGLRVAQVSLDGADGADHRAVRGDPPGAFDRAVSAVGLLRAAGVQVDVATLLTGRNAERAPEMLRRCEALGVRKLRYCSFVPAGRAASPAVQRTHEATPEQVDAFLSWLRARRARPGGGVEVVIDHGVGPWAGSGCFHCVAGRRVAYVTTEGDLYPCPALLFVPFRVGNVRETPLGELLRSPRMAGPRRGRRRLLAEPCRSCAVTRCDGGCPGNAFARTRDAFAAPAYCNVQRRLATSQAGIGRTT